MGRGPVGSGSMAVRRIFLGRVGRGPPGDDGGVCLREDRAAIFVATFSIQWRHMEVGALTHVGIRALKNHLSDYVARARNGDVIVVTDRGEPVARLEPVHPDSVAALRALASRLGTAWQGGKPRGVPLEDAVRLNEAQALSRAIEEDR